jgi:hypothetical protein
MRKGILGVLALMGMVLFSVQGIGQTIGVGESLKLGSDQIDEQCVINCLQDDGQSSGECKRADVIACRENCNLPPPATLFVGGIAFNPDIEDPGKVKGIFDSALRQIGITENEAATYISYSKDNPLATLGINPAITGFLTLVNPGTVLTDVPGLGNSVVYSGEIPCMASKTYTYPSGLKGVGCRELKKFGTTGWAAQGCGTEASATSDAYFGDWSTFCCNALGRPCPTCPLQAGYGVCTVNSTVGGDGVY